MCEQRLGNADQAKAWLLKATRMPAGKRWMVDLKGRSKFLWYERLPLEVLFNEAKAMIGIE
jgi:hypothetical protein